ncbi:MAG: hypothetical protein Q8830_02520 [Candidatus Phytoplasma australasiaticum]|nr:hypothetical protein [Candidatus Phytoplasma australasiaticum]
MIIILLLNCIYISFIKFLLYSIFKKIYLERGRKEAINSID